jgi:hypothetical protein
MRLAIARFFGVLLMLGIAFPAPAPATDVDGPDDCTRSPIDFGDAPEGVQAYPGVPGRFPTCLLPGPVGTQELACPPISTLPAATGFVRHVKLGYGYWLGCDPANPLPMGIDSETNGKTNDTGGPFSACNPTLTVDCFETAFGLTFGQDECYGSNDAGLAGPMLMFAPCTPSSVTFQAYSCDPPHQVYLNILVDWNQDGDWNDNFLCGTLCAYEWAVKNVPILLNPGCQPYVSPGFMTGPTTGPGWMRITLSDQPVNDDFPWAGSVTMLPPRLSGGETEDYPIEVWGQQQSCPDYEDWGDAPEFMLAYPSGVPGRFPTCSIPGGPGTMELACPPISLPPGPSTGYVRHVATATDPAMVWLGCGTPPGFPGVDTEIDGKTNSTGAALSVCNPALVVDCFEAAFGMTFGQDECYSDLVDAGVSGPLLTFAACSTATVSYNTFNCMSTTNAFLNILVDMNEDGDWNDNFLCLPAGSCAYEWAVKNQPILVTPGCVAQVSPPFLMGPNAGNGWMRVTITFVPVGDDFPWNGSAAGLGYFEGGETEDYPVEIRELAQPCPSYEDWGDAPEIMPAYPSGVIGRFPTCSFPGAPSTMELACPPISLPPGPSTGYVRHVAAATDPAMVWLGCGTPPGSTGIDSEIDGKFNSTGAPLSVCNPALVVDCFEAAFGMTFGQDECYSDLVDAGVSGPLLTFATCTNATVNYNTFNCKNTTDAYLNILVDMNQDGDWNDNFLCSGTACAYEWAVKNQPIVVTPGCVAQVSPPFLMGPNPGNGWMRITITFVPVGDDFPWNGSAAGPGYFEGGETEDYPVEIHGQTQQCPRYEDWGDAPEGVAAYPWGLLAHFPTCSAGSPPGTQELGCAPPLSTPPGVTGYVTHVATPTDPAHFWLGCGTPGVDGESDGKMNNTGALVSQCATNVAVDCVEPAFGMSFGQDECYGDGVDAGLSGPMLAFARCSLGVVPYKAYNCSNDYPTVYLNILVDWNRDEDWNDMVLCPAVNLCAPEWAVKNASVALAPGCNSLFSPSFRVGPQVGGSWMRITLTNAPVTDDFPWAGSAQVPAGVFIGGETEDYPVEITPSLVSVGDVPRRGGLWMGPIVPNPSRSGIAVEFSLPREDDVSLAVYDIAGRKLAELANGRMSAGEHRVPWNFADGRGVELSPGYFVVKLRVGDQVLTQRGIRMR